MNRRFSILITTYNREKYLKETIDSVLSQTFTDYETIIIDDGSTDRTAELVKSYEVRIKSIFQSNQGPEVAHNKGFYEANREYIAFLDDDDLFLPWTLATYNRIIREFDSPPLILGSMVYLNPEQELQTNAFHTDTIKLYNSGISFQRISEPIFRTVKSSFGNPFSMKLADR
jgi:Glycosyltransferases involved in cell wall biogenesis